MVTKQSDVIYSCVYRDVASGSKRITEVSEAFHSSAEILEQQAKTYQVRSLAPFLCPFPTPLLVAFSVAFCPPIDAAATGGPIMVVLKHGWGGMGGQPLCKSKWHCL